MFPASSAPPESHYIFFKLTPTSQTRQIRPCMPNSGCLPTPGTGPPPPPLSFFVYSLFALIGKQLEGKKRRLQQNSQYRLAYSCLSRDSPLYNLFVHIAAHFVREGEMKNNSSRIFILPKGLKNHTVCIKYMPHWYS